MASGGGDSKRGSIRALTALNLFIGDVQTGMGPYVTLFFKAQVHLNPAQIGTAIAAGNLAQVLAQTPVGTLIDRSAHKRRLIVGGASMIAAGGLLIATVPRLPAAIAGQSLIGVAGSIFPPCIAAVALGLVGRDRLEQQTSRNQSFNAAGRVMTALLAAAVGYLLGLRWMLFLLIGLAGAAIFCTLRIKEGDINQALARGADQDSGGGDGQGGGAKPGAGGQEAGGGEEGFWAGGAALWSLLKDRAVLTFLASAVLYQAANAAIIPLVTQLLSGGRHGRQAVLFTAGFVVTSQAAALVAAALAGKAARARGRKPVVLFGFALLAALAVLLTLSKNPFYVTAVETLGGVCIGVFGVVSVLIIADLTKGTGRFNAAQGGIAAAQGVGSFLSNSAAGLISRHVGQNAAFLTLAALAATGFVFTWRMLKETRPPDDAGGGEDRQSDGEDGDGGGRADS